MPPLGTCSETPLSTRITWLYITSILLTSNNVSGSEAGCRFSAAFDILVPHVPGLKSYGLKSYGFKNQAAGGPPDFSNIQPSQTSCYAQPGVMLFSAAKAAESSSIRGLVTASSGAM